MQRKPTSRALIRKSPGASKVRQSAARHHPARPQPPVARSWWARQWEALQSLAQTQPETLWFCALLAAAAILRWWQPDWYLNQQFHPDERWIFGVVSQLSYPAEPIALQYGTFPLYILATIKDAAAAVAGWFGHFDANRFVIGAGRMLSGLFDLGTLIFTYLLGRRMLPGAEGRKLGLLAATLLAFTVLNIQMAHFFVVDVPLTFLTVAALYWSARIAQEGRRQDYLLAGVFLGLAMATKTSALPLAAGVAAAHLIGLYCGPEKDQPRRWLDLGLAAAASLVAFFLAMPYAFLDWSRFWTNQNEQRRILVTGQADVPYNRQYLHTLPFIYYAKNLLYYTMGWFLGVPALAAFIAYPLKAAVVAVRDLGRRSWKHFKSGLEREAAFIPLMTFGVVYALIIGTSFAKFNRYLLPLAPVLILAASRLAAELKARAAADWAQRLVAAATGLVVAATLFWALAFTAVYRAEHPWIAASRWMLQHIPETTLDNGFPRQTAVLNEEWGDDLPVGVPGVAGKSFRNNKFPVQEPDTPRKREIILAMLQQNDWIVMADTRAHAVYRRLPERYPINAAYYELMFAEKLGFKLAAEFKNYPRLLGYEFADDRADESFTLYDHPHVYLFQRQDPALPAEELARRLDAAVADIQARVKQGIRSAPAPARAVAKTAPALPTVVNKNIGRPQGKPVFILGRLNSFTAALAWILLLAIIGLLSAPLTISIFPKLPDCGIALAKITGTLVFTWVVWLLVSVGLMQHLQSNSLLVLLALGGLSGYWVWRKPEKFRAFVRQKGSHWLTAEIVFFAAFAAYMLTKLYNPDIHNPFGQGYNGGGEPMGMTFFTAVYKSAFFPPYDPWLSGYSINYYYYGQVILGILAKLIGVPPAWSYSIAVSLLFALTFTGLYGLGLGLTGKKRWGLAAAAAGVMLGNLQAFFYLLEPLNRGQIFQDGFAGLAQWARQTWQHAGRFEFIWNPTRLIKGTINEMPWFSFLYGDLHAHIVAIPYSLPLIAWALNLLKQKFSAGLPFPEAPGATVLERGLTFFVAALTLGALSAINTWNFPPYALLVLTVLITSAWQEKPGAKHFWRNTREVSLAWLRLAAVGVLCLFFFHKNFKPQSTTLAFVNPNVRTQPREFLIFFGLPVFALVSWWASELVPGLQKAGRKILPPARRPGPWWQTALSLPQKFWALYPRTFYILCSAFVGLALLAFFEQLLVGLLPLLLAVGLWVLLRRPLLPELKLTLLLGLIGLVIVWGCEIVHVRDFMGVGGDMSRMNTVFKFYMVVWILFALAAVGSLKTAWDWLQKKHRRVLPAGQPGRLALWTAGVLAAWALANYFQVQSGTSWLTWTLGLGILVLPWTWAAWPGLPPVQWAWRAMLAALVAACALYPPLSLYNRMRLCSEFRHPTLNGAAYLERMNPQDAKALAWINQNIRATDIVLEAPGRQGYNCFDTRVAIFTGQPTLIGWIGQEEQMRYNNELTGSHTADANSIFGTLNPEEAGRLMERYQVKYVYVGNNERKIYAPAALAKFSVFMDTVYDQDGVTIYHVRKAKP